MLKQTCCKQKRYIQRKMSFEISLCGLHRLIWNDTLRKRPKIPFRVLHATIVFSPLHYHGFTIVLSLFHHRTIAFSPSYCRGFIIGLSLFHHRSIVLSPSYCRIITIVLSCFHLRVITIVLSSSHYRVFTIVLSPSGAHAYTNLKAIALSILKKTDRYIFRSLATL